MSGAEDERPPARVRETLEEQIRRKGVRPMVTGQEWRCPDLFPEEGELEEFLVELDRWRHPERH